MTLGKLLTAGAAYLIYKAIREIDGASNSQSVEQTRIAEQRRKAVYTGNQIAKGQIRLLKRISQVGTWSLEPVDLGSNPIYDALSYTWTDAAEDQNIDISGHKFPVTENLLEALTQHADTSTNPLWVDAICIRQWEHEEKAEQVSQMTRVYENARRVVIWLGGGGEGSGDAFELLASFESLDDDEMFTRSVLRSYQSVSDTHRWVALARLLARRWWTRAWIFQEVLAAKEAEIWWGRDRCGWNVVAALAIVIEENLAFFLENAPSDSDSSILTASHHHAYNLAIYQRQRNILCPPSLSEALQTRRQANATDLRDKVYCLLGICREEQYLPRSLRGGTVLDSGQVQTPSGPDLKICYDSTHSVADVYKGVARHIITKSRHLEILSACQNLDRNLGIPLWAPDWSVRRTTNPIMAPDLWGRLYHASTDDSPFKFEPGPSSDEIIVRGVFVGSVDVLGSVRKPTTPYDDVGVSWAGIAMKCSMAHSDGTPLKPNEPCPRDIHNHYSRDGETVETAFVRTCSMARIPEFRGKGGINLTSSGVDDDLVRREIMARTDATENRRFAKLNNGMMGLFPAETQRNDDVFIIAGADVPFVIHNKFFGDRVIVGECYVHGIMNGEINALLERTRMAGMEVGWTDLILK